MPPKHKSSSTARMPFSRSAPVDNGRTRVEEASDDESEMSSDSEASAAPERAAPRGRAREDNSSSDSDSDEDYDADDEFEEDEDEEEEVKASPSTSSPGSVRVSELAPELEDPDADPAKVSLPELTAGHLEKIKEYFDRDKVKQSYHCTTAMTKAYSGSDSKDELNVTFHKDKFALDFVPGEVMCKPKLTELAVQAILDSAYVAKINEIDLSSLKDDRKQFFKDMMDKIINTDKRYQNVDFHPVIIRDAPAPRP